MATVLIPTDTSFLFWSQTTTLDGTPYLLTFRYNSREQVYYLQIQSSDGVTTYAQGIKLVANYQLLRGYATPPGELMVVSTDPQQDQPPALGEMGASQRCALLYIEADDLYATGTEGNRNPGFLVVPVYVAVTTSSPNAPADAIRAAVASAVNGAGTVSISAIGAAIANAVPSVSVVSIAVGFTSPPGLFVDLPLPPTYPPRLQMAALRGCLVNGQ